MTRLFLSLLLLALAGLTRADPPSAAFYYGPDIPWRELALFDLTVIEPAQAKAPPADQVGRVYAYVSLGEVLPSRDYAAGIRPEWVLGDNPDWQTRVLDLSKPALRRYLIEQVVAPLWRRGYRRFFFDTLDSYRLGVESEAALAEQRQGLETLIQSIAATFPGARFILNRGFELLPAVHAHVDAVAAESLYQRWRPDLRRYQAVSEEDRQWLLDRFAEVRQRYQLPTIAIDYAPPEDRDGARELARRIAGHDVIPWVSNPALDMLGVGRREVMPRRVLMLHGTPPGGPWEQSELVRYALMPVQHLGLVPDIRYQGGVMPAGTLRGRYAGIITWLNEPEQVSPRLGAWLARQAEAGVPVVMLGRLPVAAGERAAGVFGLQPRPQPAAPPRVARQAPEMGFEAPLPGLLQVADAVALDQGRGQPWLTLSAGDQEYTVAAVTDWGGFALNPFVVSSLLPTVQSDETAERWLLQPLVFLRQALKLPPMPIPDVTTENGRRLLFAHMDGDGFPSLAEVRGYRNQAAGEVLLQEILKRYRVPTTLSVIEGEVAETGLYADRAEELEDIAQRMFLLDHVEAATHTYSHPFYWRESLRHPDQAASADGTALRLPIADYRLDLERELVGSADYMRRRLLPPDKPVKMVLWSGDTVATEAALKIARENGLLNMNGSDTVITESAPSWTLIKGIGLPKGDEYQVFAPNQNENLYTGRWQGPFYGYERVIETFRLTGEPIRFKPIDIYYHTYIASKNASLTSLKKVYDWALAQPVNPVFASEYVAKVLDFNRMVVAREGDSWLVRGEGDLRTLRLPDGVAPPALADSQGVAGYRDQAPGPYVHLADGQARWRPGPDHAPGLWEANGRLTGFLRFDDGLTFSLRAHVPLTFTLIQPAGCRLRHQGRTLNPVARDGTHYRYRSDRRELEELRLQCGP
ncbi:bifunctional glycoside hydrolase 114/ polysaccharide deacetylase family protein [Alloalcanivorax marinus]|uniref:bifunctional glycoside hydrolase 114/ polysaccharide deacetylase family protein n=1 Tax=Alloalcanivorax marinus TaxID=1177169 RepID=UPI001EE44862|nr:endo alpha-1,4 polygalactosaminidase [Alloalcanivorax marinus]